MKIVYTARALHQLREIYAYISKNNETAAVFYKILAERDEIRILRVRHMRQR